MATYFEAHGSRHDFRRTQASQLWGATVAKMGLEHVFAWWETRIRPVSMPHLHACPHLRRHRPGW